MSILNLPYTFSKADDGTIVIEKWDESVLGARPANYESALVQLKAVEDAKVPASVTMRQARRYLLSIKKLNDINNYINTVLVGDEKDAALADWEYSSTVERNQPLVGQIGKIIGFTDAQLDEAFRQAAKF